MKITFSFSVESSKCLSMNGKIQSVHDCAVECYENVAIKVTEVLFIMIIRNHNRAHIAHMAQNFVGNITLLLIPSELSVNLSLRFNILEQHLRICDFFSNVRQIPKFRSIHRQYSIKKAFCYVWHTFLN